MRIPTLFVDLAFLANCRIWYVVVSPHTYMNEKLPMYSILVGTTVNVHTYEAYYCIT
jgi:hypothetical protein